MLTDLLFEAGRFVYTAAGRDRARDAPLGADRVVAGVGDRAARARRGARAFSEIGWWGHNLLILTLLNVLPLSKHFHIITGLPNVFFRKLEPLGALAKQDLENATSFGTSHIDQFTWKQVLDMYTCTECGRCSSNCPATMTGKPLAPRQLLLESARLPLRAPERAAQRQAAERRVAERRRRRRRRAAERPRAFGAEPDRRRQRHPRRGAVELQHLPRLRGGLPGDDRVRRQDRRHAPQPGPGGGALPRRADAHLQGHGDAVEPVGPRPGEARRVDRGARRRPLLADKPDAEYLYYVGCGGAFDDRNKKTTIAFAKILQKAGVDFAIMGKEELCNGDSARRLGNEYLYQSMAQMLVEVLQRLRREEDHRQLPALLQHLQQRVPAVRRHATRSIHAAELVKQLLEQRKIDAQDATASTASRSPTTTPATTAASTTCTTRRARSSRRSRATAPKEMERHGRTRHVLRRRRRPHVDRGGSRQARQPAPYRAGAGDAARA